MPLQLDKVHVHSRDQETNRMVLLGTNPYIRWVAEGEAPIILQEGVFYSDGGNRILHMDVPSWVWKNVAALSAEAIEKVKLKNIPSKEDKPKKAKDAPAEAVEPEVVKVTPPTLSDVLMGLDHSDSTHWTKTGLPDLNTVKERMNKYHSRQTVEEAIPGFRRKE
jgi:hypothetical protein|tara:strand:+ start:5110 stop:5601 length:492 start_codon:yes stop_codon:yes gene_type:complete